MKVINHQLCYDDGKPVPFKHSPNIGRKIKEHKYLGVHYTGTMSASSAISWMLNPTAKVSAHLHLDSDGKWVQLVKFDTTAWHFGASEWKGLKGLNSYSIGIEISNDGKKPYTQAQLDALVDAGRALHEAYDFEDILKHSEVAIPLGRKSDPGNHFPMASFKSQVLNGGKPNLVVTKHTSTDLNLREGSGTNFKTIQVLKKGTEVNVLSEKDGWSQVFICDSKALGWVSSKYLK